MTKKLITILLLASMAVTALASCASESTQTSDTTTASADTTVAAVDGETTAEGELQPDVPMTDYKGRDFRVYSRSMEHVKWASIDITAEEENGEPINDAVFARNRKLEENFNIKVVNIPVYNPVKTITPLILANEDIAEVLTDGLQYVAPMITEGNVIDFNKLPYIDFDAPWWDQALIYGLSVNDAVYMMTGDISVTDNVGTWALGFNKDMRVEFDLKDPYELVNNGQWTYDEMFDMMKAVPADLDGDGTMGDFDRYGLVSQKYNTYSLFGGSGALIATKDEDDLPYLTMNTERNVDALGKALMIQNDKNISLLAEWVKGKYTQVYDECINKNFGENRAMFWIGGMKVVEILRGYDVNFGLLPMPKLDEAQENYYNSYSTPNLCVYAIPVTNSDLDFTGEILEAMAAYSKYTLTPAYYEITLKGKSLRDEESEAMLDLIFATRLYDLGAVFNWGSLRSLLDSMSGEDVGSFASKYAAQETTAQTQIDEFIEKVTSR